MICRDELALQMKHSVMNKIHKKATRSLTCEALRSTPPVNRDQICAQIWVSDVRRQDTIMTHNLDTDQRQWLKQPNGFRPENWKSNKMTTNWWGRQNAASLKFDPKPSDAAFRSFFSNFGKCRSKVAGDIISGVAVKYVGTHVCSTCGGCVLNSGRNIWLFGWPDQFYASLLCSI